MNTMSAAQREIHSDERFAGSARNATLWPEVAGAQTQELKAQVAARLAAHRARRNRLMAVPDAKPSNPAAQPASQPRSARRTDEIAAAVAQRYAHSPSYRTFLAQEADRATRQAAAAAEVAARNATAIANAQQQLLVELNRELEKEERDAERRAGQQGSAAAAPVSAQAANKRDARPEAPEEPILERLASGLTVKLYEDAGRTQRTEKRSRRSTSHPAGQTSCDPEEAEALDEEIAFRQAPVFEEPHGPPEPIPANLLEFPRQLVAPRKARPTLALGPLRETAAPMTGQLRIFEVEPEQISPEPTVPEPEPEWKSIWLDSATPPTVDVTIEPEKVQRPDLAPAPMPPQVASIGRRAMAAAVDAILILAGTVAFGAAFIAISDRLPVPEGPVTLGPPVAVAAIATLLVLAVCYQWLFFSFSDQTPGMRYARIGLCTFSDENPTRAQMRRRLWMSLLALAPLGLGVLWALLDNERMGWHDRLSRMYQREY
jgi:uncharacterized RDD family membrane protein YckC